MTSETHELQHVAEAERRLASDQALASSRIEGHVPTSEFLADCEAVSAGAMTLDALRAVSLARALTADRAAACGTQEEPAFLDDEGPSTEIPPFITTTNARELYDLRPGETVSEAIARRDAKQG